ncbi:hypothetical protein [Pseudonocardia sp. GCM10023141]|uniref:hypothetical protein n=1 Tax=Pseudonocardia sp. GCM10023141 TaxID=3252653 RepID=UPI0036D2D65E
MIFFALVAAFICAKVRVVAGAVVFTVVALVLFVGTPAGNGLPSAVASFLHAVNGAATPVLTKTDPGSEAVG